MVRCWVSIGSNQDRERSIRGAVQSLRERFGALTLSSVFESAAVGFEGSPFLNLVAGFDSDEPVRAIRDALRAIEDRYGRVRGPDKFMPRTLDLDLLVYGDRTGRLDGLDLPRDEILHYAFVLAPLAEVAGGEIHPLAGCTYRALWEAFDEPGQALARVPLDLGAAP
jgi:2-amino-4-hydroxy-6-hydroxymethyldihydropteridine diphosphokinase